jgi:hypothetical protein
MVKRILIAGVLGGIAMFIVMAAGHLSPFGETGINFLPREILITETLASGAGQREGLYLFPADPEAPDSVPSGFMVLYPYNVMRMTAAQPLTEFAKDIVQALLLAALMAQMAASGFGRRMLFATAAAAMVVLTTHGSFAIWYHFPLDFVLADGLIAFAGYVTAGAVIAAVLPRRTAVQRETIPA